jgi:hypothetical protein
MAYNLFLDDIHNPRDVANLKKTTVKDRERYRKYGWVIVRSYDDFVNTIKNKGVPDIVSFDHDLAPEHYEILFSNENWSKGEKKIILDTDDWSDEIILDYDKFKIKTGYHAAEWLVEYCNNTGNNMPICLIHSQNDVGRKNIINLLF